MDKFLVRVTGIEPARRKALDPKSSASASSATLANQFVKGQIYVRVILYLRVSALSRKVYTAMQSAITFRLSHCSPGDGPCAISRPWQ